MVLDTGTITAIIGGVTNLTSSFVGLGASIYAADHQPGAVADNYSYNIVLPEQKSESVLSPGIIVLIAVLLIVMVFGAFIVYKIS